MQLSTQAPVVAAVQGTNDLRAINVASQFLTGCDFDCLQTPQNQVCDCLGVLHVPSSWPCVQLHLDPNVRYRDFYLDTTYAQPGKTSDESKPDGLEFYPFLFYAGEGAPEHFDAWPGMLDKNEVNLPAFSLGDVNVRYLLMLSCNLFAHGPRKSAISKYAADFIAPEDFDPSKVNVNKTSQDPDPQSKYMADVFYRWGRKYDLRSPLNRGLRLACGGSSRIGATSYPAHRFWYYFSIVGWRPADAFLAGLYAPEIQEEPLCISRGDSLQDSGLADWRFEDEPLLADPQKPSKSIFIEYPIRAAEDNSLTEKASQWAPVSQVEITPPQAEPPYLPVLVLGPAPVPPLLKGVDLDGPALDYGFRGLSASAIKTNLEFLSVDPGSPNLSPILNAEDLCVKRHPDSGSLVFSWRPAARSGQSLAAGTKELDKELDKASNAFLKRLFGALPVPGSEKGELEPKILVSDTIHVQMRISAAPEMQNLQNGELGMQEISRTNGCFYLIEKQAVSVAGVVAPILGEGSETFVGWCPASARRIELITPSADSSKDACRRADPSLASFVYNNRVYKGKRDSAQKSIKAAEPDAWTRLEAMKRREAYDLVRVRWGYRAAPVHCNQEEMFPVYEFDFLPKPDPRYRDYSPLTIEVPAHSLPAERIEDTWTCSPEKPPGKLPG